MKCFPVMQWKHSTVFQYPEGEETLGVVNIFRFFSFFPMYLGALCLSLSSSFIYFIGR